jgi:hypothetical protein
MITTQQKIADGIYLKIKTLIGTSVGNRVYEMEAPQNASLPMVIFTIVTDDVEPSLNCDREETSFQAQIYGYKKNGAKAVRTISDTLFSGLNNNSITIDDVNVSNTILGSKGTPSVVGDIIEILQEYNIKIQ